MLLDRRTFIQGVVCLAISWKLQKLERWLPLPARAESVPTFYDAASVPGWHTLSARYDLDRGTVQAMLDGQWVTPDEALPRLERTTGGMVVVVPATVACARAAEDIRIPVEADPSADVFYLRLQLSLHAHEIVPSII